MKRFVIILGLCFLAKLSSAQTTVLDSFKYEGIMRHVRVYIPANRKCALIIHLHGYSSNGGIEQLFTNYMPVADTAGFLVAYPDGLKDNSGYQYWNVGWSFLPNTDDVGFLSALIDTLVHKFAIDPNTVFASGLSNGGFMCHKLACELGNKIAAIASISASMTLDEYSSCKPSRAVPVLEIHGTADVTIPYSGATGTTNSEDVDSVVKHCAILDQCSSIPVHTLLVHNTATTDGSTVDHYVYTGGQQGATCELYKINGGTHVEWAGGYGNFDFNASQEIWRFFSNYRKSNCTGLGLKASNTKQNIISCYPNPFTEEVWLNIQMPELKEMRIAIRNNLGQIIFQKEERGTGGSYIQNINLHDLPSGIYTLEVLGEGIKEVRKLVKL